MGKLLDTITAGSSTYVVETHPDGYILVGDTSHREEFNCLVRELINRQSDEFVVLPVKDDQTGYARAIILPM